VLSRGGMDGEVPSRGRPLRRLVEATASRRRSWALISAMTMAIVLPGPIAHASEPVSGYGNTTSTPTSTTPAPTTSTPTPTTPAPPPIREKEEPAKPKEQVTRPSHELEKPVEPDETNQVAAASAAPPVRRQLPFTGWDLRLELGLGALLIAAGTSILLIRRRRA
jgi:uncharacterized surface anchored protein